MTLPRDRDWHLRCRLRALEASFDERLKRLEGSAHVSEPTEPRGLVARLRGSLAATAKWMGPVLPQLLSSVVMLVLGLWVKDSVDLAIKERQLQLTALSEMKGELQVVADSDKAVEVRKRAALLAAAFGKPAIIPLVHEMRMDKSGNGLVAAEAGLASLSITDQASVCEVLLGVVASPTPWLEAPALMATVRTLGAAGCASALPTLRGRLDLARAARQGGEGGEGGEGAEGKPAEVLRLVSARPSATQLKSLVAELEKAIASIESNARPRGWRP